MLKRTITGFFIALVTIAFFLLRIFVNEKLFDILIYGSAIVGAYETTKLMGSNLTKLGKILVVGFPVIVMPFITFLPSYAFLVGILYTALALLISIFDKPLTSEDNSLSNITSLLFTAYYPTLPLICLQLINGTLGNYSLIGILSVFLIAQLTDVFAYFIGSLLKGKKLIPSISPNKTISGAIGGLIGGIIGSVASYFITLWCGINPFKWDVFAVIIFLVLTGAVLSIINQIGDLFESYLKRKAGVKDSGNIFPGHGGMLDRVDGLSFVALVTFVIYSFLA